ncbi:MAG: cupin domain-containing protein [Pseudomonadota bacterium]
MSSPTYRFDDRLIHWQPFRGFEGLDYYLLSVDERSNQVYMLMRFAPNQCCVPHRHVGPTKTLVLDGEHQIFEHDGTTSHRPAGTFSQNQGDEAHLEGGGPDGAIILLTMTAVDGVVYDILSEDETEVVRQISLHDFQRGLARQASAA